MNYRLGAFGFLHLDEIFGERLRRLRERRASSTRSQHCEWVRDNIAAFGGNPDDVTIFGESAGGMSIGTLLGLPAAEGLYHRAIIQSGSSSFASRAESATKIARDVLEIAGITTVEELESAPAEAILAAQTKLTARGARLDLAFQPVVDGTVLPDVPLETIASGATGDVPLMIGTTLDEMTLFLALELGVGELDGDALNRQMQRFFGDRAAEVVDTYTQNRAGSTPADVLTAISTDRVFRIPAIRARRGAGAPGPVHAHVPVHVAEPGDGRQAEELPRARAAVHVGRARPAAGSPSSPATGPSARASPT